MSRWPSVQIRRLAAVGTGHTPSRKHPEYWEGERSLPWLTTGDVSKLRSGQVTTLYDTVEKVTEIGLANSSAVMHPAETVAMSRTASVGFTCVMGVAMATSQDWVTWTCGPDLLPRFLLWSLRGNMPRVLGRMHGSTHKTIYMDELLTLRTTVPSPPEQERIAAFLDEETNRIDTLINEYQNQIRLVDEQLLSIVADLLGHAVQASALSLSSSPLLWRLGVLPVDIQTGPFGSQLHEADYEEGGWPVVNPANLADNKLEANRWMCISDAKRAELGNHILRLGDLVLGRRGAMGRCGLVSEEQVGWVCGTGSMRVRVERSVIEPSFMHEWLISPFAANFLRANAVGTTMDNLNESLLGSLPVWLPPVKQQITVVSEIQGARTVADETRRTCQSQIDSLRELRQALISTAVSEGVEACEAVA